MRWDARGTIALLASALVGITAGVLVALTTHASSGTQADGPNPSGPSSTTTGNPDDPLGLDVPLQNLPCNGETILVVGWADTRSPMLAATSANPDGVKYLETAKSCPTLYGAERRPAPKYAAYLGPFDNIAEPCSLRLNVDHQNDLVTALNAGVNMHVQCLCVLEPRDFPNLAVGMVADARDGIYIRALQRLLVDINQNPTHHVNGRYDETTRNLIIPLQRLHAIRVHPRGLVETSTWEMLRDLACVNYDF